MSSKSDMNGDGRKLRKLDARRQKRLRTIGLVFWLVALPILFVLVGCAVKF
jgi:hypothetical protein